MPSPVGHALAGLAAGWMVLGTPPFSARATWGREAALFGSLAVLPDADLLVGAHSGPTHGIGTAALVGLVAFALWPGAAPVRARGALACALAYGTHILLDWLGSDSTAPIGIMALWPLSRDYYESSLHVFMAISRRYWQGAAFWRQNMTALARELLILGPVFAAVAFWRRRGSHRSRRRSANRGASTPPAASTGRPTVRSTGRQP
jgi:inner membrane protein